MLKIIVVIAVVLVLGFFLIGVTIPSVSYEATVTVDRHIETTFAVFTDSDRMVEWLEGFKSMEHIEGEPDTVGARYRFEFEEGGTIYEVDEVTTAFDENALCAFEIRHEFFRNDTVYRFDDEDGRTIIEMSGTMTGASWIWRSVLPFMKSTLAEKQRKTLDLFALAVEKSPTTLAGIWSGIDGRGGVQTFTFERNGDASWRVTDGMATTVTELQYEVDYSVNPFHLDLKGFSQGPLAGRALYGILLFDDDDTMRFDANVGLLESDESRPDSFTSSTVTYARAGRRVRPLVKGLLLP